MARVYLIRHGTTENNLKGIFQGSLDIPLGEQGRRQAQCLREKLKNKLLEAVYTSPLIRARQTAEEICIPYGFTPKIEEGLRELNGGLLEGYDSERNKKMYPQQMYELNHRPGFFQAPEGESSSQVYQRMVRTMADIAMRHPHGNIAVVSHGFAIQLYLGYVKQVPFDQIQRYIVGNASICVLEYDEKGGVKPSIINDESHIPKELRFYVAKNFMKDD